ncbi:MAG: GntR family transcriptional regulator [Paracoccaceae bacterium]
MTDRPSGPETLVRGVLHGLAEGRFVPGQRLSEPDLMARFALGRSTVREGLGRLAAAGIVALPPHRGAVVRFLDRRAARDVLLVSASLLGLAARQAAQAVAEGADPAPLQQAVSAYDHAEGDRARARARYYRALIALGGNAELDRLLPALQVPLIRAQLRGYRPPGRTRRGAMVAAIVAGQPDRAEAEALGYVREFIAALAQAPDSAFAPDLEQAEREF